jgi:SNF2 family DNA or RNA helicase
MRRAVKWLLEHGGAALFLDPGLGKTSITLAAIKVLLKEGVLEKVMIIAPLRVCYSVWPREIDKWVDFQHITYAICHGPDKETAIRKDVNIYLVNPEGLEWFLENWKLVKPDTLVVDESTKFKNMKSLRSKVLAGFLPKFKRRWILTGTPAPNGLLDLFGQMYIVDLGLALGRFITHYRNTYFDSTGFGGYTWKLREGSDRLIYKKLKPYVLRLQAEDYLDLPDIVENDVVVVLPPKAMVVYEKMEEEAFAELDKETVINAANAAAATGKCRQIANGGAYIENGKYVDLHTVKLEALESILEERGGRPVLVAYEFKHDYERACRYFKTKFPVIGGGTSAKMADKHVQAWNAGDLPVLWVHPASAGHGLNMQGCDEADCIVWFTPTWDRELYDQLVARLRRQGSKLKRLYVHRIVGYLTVDFAVLRAITKKDAVQRGLLDALRTYRKEKTKKLALVVEDQFVALHKKPRLAVPAKRGAKK